MSDCGQCRYEVTECAECEEKYVMVPESRFRAMHEYFKQNERHDFIIMSARRLKRFLGLEGEQEETQ